MIIIKIIFFGLIFSKADCARLTKKLNSNKIIGGEMIDISKVPYQVLLEYANSRGYLGAGVIISESWILTASHCIRKIPSFKLIVVAGTSKLLSGGTFYGISRIIHHERYDQYTGDYDFALLQLMKNITWNKNIKPIQLPIADQDLPDGSLCIISGFGFTHLYENELSADLRAVEVPIVNQEKCKERYSGYVTLTPRMLCAGYDEGGKDACYGDGGGPLVHNETLYGIILGGYYCALEYSPGVYGRVTSIRKWIKQNTDI